MNPKVPPYLFIINRVLFNFFLRLQQLVLKAIQKKLCCPHLLKRKEKVTVGTDTITQSS